MFWNFISHNDHLRWVLVSLFYRQGIQDLGKLSYFPRFTKAKDLNHCPSDFRAYVSSPVTAAARTPPVCLEVTLTGKPYSLLLDLHFALVLKSFANAFVQI